MNIAKSVAVAVTAGALLFAGCGTTRAADEPAGPPAAAAASAPADNGVADLPVAEILERVEAALTAARSFHMYGSEQVDGQAMTFDLKRSGDDLLGAMSFDGAKLETLVVGEDQFFRFNQKMATMVFGAKKLGVAPAVLARTWLRPAPGDTSFAKLIEDFDVAGVLQSVGGAAKAERTVSDGHPVIVLRDDESGDALYVATTGEPLPLKLGSTDGGEGGLLFREFGASFPEIAAPDPKNVVKLSAQTKKS